MEEKNIKRKEWVKTAAIVFLSIMLVLTFFSNTIMNYSLPEVATEFVYPENITMQVRGTGTVESGDPYNVTIDENRVIKSVLVQNGDAVQKGQILFYLEDADNTGIKELENQVEQAEIAYKQALLGDNVSQTVYNNMQNGVTTDMTAYQNSVQSLKNTVSQIEKAIEDLTTQRANLEATLITIGGAEKDLATAQAEAETKKAAQATAQASYNDYKSRVDNYDANDLAGTETETKEDLEALLASTKATLDALAQEVHVADSIVAVLKQKETCEANLITANNNLTINQKALDKTRTDAQTEMELLAQKNQLDDLKDKLKEMKSKSVEGKIVAPIAGTVSGISHVAGETIMAGEAAAVMQPEGKGYSLSFSVSKKQANTLSVGDKGTISNGWYYSDVVATLLSIKPDPTDPSNNKKLTFNLEGDVTPGQTLTLSVGQKSALYDYTVPNNAVREDKDGKFILVLEQKPSPLGTRYYAVRRNVEVLTSDDRRSALTGDVYEYEYVITTSTKPIQEGQQVRLKDN